MATQTITVNIANELVEDLTRLAEAEKISIDELVEAVLSGYVAEQSDITDIANYTGDEPSKEELAAVYVSIKEASKPGAKWYSDEEFDDELARELANRQKARKLVRLP